MTKHFRLALIPGNAPHPQTGGDNSCELGWISPEVILWTTVHKYKVNLSGTRWLSANHSLKRTP